MGITECVIGIFGIDERNEVVDFALFPKDADVIAEAIGRLQGGEVVDELVRLIEELKSRGYERFVFESDALADSVRERLGVEVEVEKPSMAGDFLRKGLAKVAIEVGYVKEPEEVHSLIRNVSMILTRGKIQQAHERRDLLLAQAVVTLDDLNKTANLLSNRLREWYGLHFPELSSMIDHHESYLRLIYNLGDRKGFTAGALLKDSFPEERAMEISRASQSSIGAGVSQEDIEMIRSLSKTILDLYSARHRLEDYIETVIAEVAPNIRELVGATLGARLIAAAGGLNNLAMKAASTIQVLGAEKALFRSLRTGARPPKHGIIFQLPEIHSSPRWQRGKIARAVAGKLAIAARIDAYKGVYRGEELKADLVKRVEEIKRRYKRPPPRATKSKKLKRGGSP
ncbi:MAG: C/D box methylation guide ribonucleoprotein complex aNOP56 subunit [Candidatus Bathyarchaeia archaeon]